MIWTRLLAQFVLEQPAVAHHKSGGTDPGHRHEAISCVVAGKQLSRCRSPGIVGLLTVKQFDALGEPGMAEQLDPAAVLVGPEVGQQRPHGPAWFPRQVAYQNAGHHGRLIDGGSQIFKAYVSVMKLVMPAGDVADCVDVSEGLC